MRSGYTAIDVYGRVQRDTGVRLAAASVRLPQS